MVLDRKVKGYKVGTPDLYPFPKAVGDLSLSQVTVRPRFVGLPARPRAATRSCKSMTSWRPALLARWLRCSAGGTGSAGYAGRPSHSRRAGARLLAWGLRQSGGGKNQQENVNTFFYPHVRTRVSGYRQVQFNHHAGLSAWRQPRVVHRPHPTIG